MPVQSAREVSREWLHKDLWRDQEFAALLCGLEPSKVPRGDPKVSEAREYIRRAIAVGALLGREVAGGIGSLLDDDVFAGPTQYFTPAAAIAWAATKRAQFPRFPFTANDVANVEGNQVVSPETWSRREDTLLRQIGALAWVIARTGGKFRHGDKPNANQIADAVGEILDASPDVRTHGLKSSSIRKSIQRGIEKLQR